MLECKEILKKKVADEFLSSDSCLSESEVKDKLTEIVINTDKQIIFDRKCDYKLSGCTFTLVLLYKSVYYTVNVGGAHCLYATVKESKYKNTNSRGNLSSAAGSEARISNLGSEINSVTKSTTFATNNPMKATTFLYVATRELMTNVYDAKLQDFDASFANRLQMEIVSTDHSVTNYDELLRVTKEGGIVCKDKKKIDLPYYARPFKFYINPDVMHTDLVQLSDWPALRCARAIGYTEARKIGLLVTPSIDSRKMIRGKDMYLVVATDGLWNVVETIEAIFLLLKETFKNSSAINSVAPSPVTPNMGTLNLSTPNQGEVPLPNSQSTTSPKKVNFPNDRNMAKLLGSYARLRWGNMASKYRTKVDDISVIVIGLF